MAGLQELAEMRLQSVMRKARHGNGLVTAGQRQPEHARRHLGIAVKEFVEVAHAEQQEHAGMAVLGFPVLLHHGCQ